MLHAADLTTQAAPPSCSTVFNESVLGPIRKHSLGKNILPRKSPAPVIPEPTVTKSGYSAFERMMSTFDAFEKTLAKSVQPQPDRVKGLVDQLMSTNEGAGNIGRCVTLFGNESDKGVGDTGETYTDQSKKWQDFINGYTQQPQQQVCIRVYIATIYHPTYISCITGQAMAEVYQWRTG